MNTIVSPTTTDRILRTVAITAMVTLFCGWFLFDGYVRWPKQNLQSAVESLDPVPQQLPAINNAITSTAVRELQTELDEKRSTPQRLTRKDLVKRLGEPAWQGRVQGVRQYLYFGPAGVLQVELRGDLVRRAAFDEGVHNEAELLMQKILGYGLLPVAVGMLFQFGRVITTKVALNDAGLKVPGKPLIPFDAMTGLKTDRYSKKGYLDLTYSLHGREKTVRLDKYVIRDYRAILTEICTRCGFENPLPQPHSESPEDEDHVS